MARHRKDRPASFLAEGGPDMTPLIDCVFLLLIFFMVTTVFLHTKGLEVDMPAQSEATEEKKKDINVLLDRDGKIQIKGEDVQPAALAARLSGGLALVRKPGKLPRATLNASYDLEYGRDTLEIHKDALPAGKKAVVVDDLLATGGTAAAAGELATRLNADLAGYLFLIELTALGGAARLRPANVWSVIKYDD